MAYDQAAFAMRGSNAILNFPLEVVCGSFKCRQVLPASSVKFSGGTSEISSGVTTSSTQISDCHNRIQPPDKYGSVWCTLQRNLHSEPNIYAIAAGFLAVSSVSVALFLWGLVKWRKKSKEKASVSINSRSENALIFPAPMLSPSPALFPSPTTFFPMGAQTIRGSLHDSPTRGMSALVVSAAWRMGNDRCIAPDRFVLYHNGELVETMGSWILNVLRAALDHAIVIEKLDYGDQQRPVCFEKAVVYRRGLGHMSLDKRIALFDMIRCKARKFCNVAQPQRSVTGKTTMNVSPARTDFIWFCLGNCVAILSSLATPEQASAIMDLLEERWQDLIGEMPLKISYPALEGHDCRIVTGCDPKNTRWSCHNCGSWPVLLWLLTGACIKSGRPQIARRAIDMVEQRLSKDGWPEYYDGKMGRYVGKQARKLQTWSISGYHIALPYPDVVPWVNISLSVPERDVAKLGKVLERVTATNLTAIQNNLWNDTIRRALLFNEPF